MMISPLFLVCCTLAGAAHGQELRPAQIPPAALLDVSAHLINTIVERPVQRQEPIQDWILDAQVVGNNLFSGRTFFRLQPDPQRALMTIVLQGTARLDTLGYQEPVKAYAQTFVHVQVQQPISIDDRGVHLHALMPWAQAYTYLVDMTNDRDDPQTPAVTLGRCQFRDDRAQIQTISARKVGKKTTDSFARETRPPIDNLGQGMQKALKVLTEFGFPVQPLRWSTTSTHVHAEAGLAGAAPLIAPPALPPSADVTFRIHQSALQRLAQKSLPGKTYSALDLLKLQGMIGSLMGSDGKPGPSKSDLSSLFKQLKIEPAAITFSQQAPIEIDMALDGFTITLNGSSFHQAGVDYPARSIRARWARVSTVFHCPT